jgi:general nucleoside transport system ATP-binding protein
MLLPSGAAFPAVGAPDDATVCARIVSVTKSFGKNIALNDVSVDFRKGEVHAILGENGAGKTTLVRILSGIFTPDAGHLEIAGTKVALRTRKQGATYGVGIVQQQDGLVQDITGVDNYLLDLPAQSLWLNRSRVRNELLQTAEKLGLKIRPDTPVAELTIGERQRLEIVVALMIGAEVIIFDEPTAALLTNEVQILIGVIGKLIEQRRSVIYITHKLDEVMTIADRVTVLRRGQVVGRFERGDFNKAELITAMVGSIPQKVPATRGELGEVVVEMRNVNVASSRHRCGLQDASLTVRRGEIVGVAGVVGNGQETLAEILRGLVAPSHGELRRVSDRIAFVPEDRARDGLAMSLSIADNLMVYRHGDPAFRANGRLVERAVSNFVRRAAEQVGLVLSTIAAPATSLSGGNQQKLVIAREFDREPDLIVAHNPYRGLDVVATAAVRQLILRVRLAGAGVVLISPDLDDLFDVSDRIIFLSNGRVSGSIDPRSTTVHALGSLLGGDLS